MTAHRALICLAIFVSLTTETGWKNPRRSESLNTPVFGSHTTGAFDSYDRQSRVLTLKDAIGSTFQFAVRDDTVIGAGERADDHFEIRAALLPWKRGQQIVGLGGLRRTSRSESLS